MSDITNPLTSVVVVADTSPINYLILIGQIHLLPKLYNRVLVPQAVFEELSDSDAPKVVREFVGKPPHWIVIAEAPRLPDNLLSSLLDKGELEAIALAAVVHADWLIMDELNGRAAAEELGLPIIGTVGVLLEAARRNLVNLDDVLQQLEGTNFQVSQSILAWAKRELRRK